MLNDEPTVVEASNPDDLTDVEAKANTFQVLVTKAKETVEVNIIDLPEAVMREIIAQGLKVLVNRGTSKITKANISDETVLKKEAMLKAQEQVENLKAGKIKLSGVAKAKASGAIMTEALRLARNIYKGALKREGYRIGDWTAKEISDEARKLLADPEVGPDIIAEATANIAASEKSKIKVPLDESFIAGKEKKAPRKPKDQLSAAQAGKTAKRSKKEATEALNAVVSAQHTKGAEHRAN